MPESDNSAISLANNLALQDLTARMVKVESGLAANTTTTDEIKADTAVLVSIFRHAENGAKIIVALANFAKQVGTIAIAVAAVWALIYAYRSGGPPPNLGPPG